MTKEEFLAGFSNQDKQNIADIILEYFYDTHYSDTAERITSLQQKASSDQMYRELCSTVHKINNEILT